MVVGWLASGQAYMPDLAGSLNNLANRLSAVGERGEALVVVRGGAGCAGFPAAAYMPDLAMSRRI